MFLNVSSVATIFPFYNCHVLPKVVRCSTGISIVFSSMLKFSPTDMPMSPNLLISSPSDVPVSPNVLRCPPTATMCSAGIVIRSPQELRCSPGAMNLSAAITMVSPENWNKNPRLLPGELIIQGKRTGTQSIKIKNYVASFTSSGLALCWVAGSTMARA